MPEMRQWKSWVQYFQLLWLQQCKIASVQVTKQHIYGECKYQSMSMRARKRQRVAFHDHFAPPRPDSLSCLVYLSDPLLSHNTKNEGRNISIPFSECQAPDI